MTFIVADSFLKRYCRYIIFFVSSFLRNSSYWAVEMLNLFRIGTLPAFNIAQMLTYSFSQLGSVSPPNNSTS